MDTRDLAQKLVDSLLGSHPEPGPTCPDGPRPRLLEIEAGGQWVEVDEATWRSWTGRRMVNGAEHHGPIFLMGSPDGTPPYTGRRVCLCPTCQEQVEPRYRPN